MVRRRSLCQKCRGWHRFWRAQPPSLPASLPTSLPACHPASLPLLPSSRFVHHRAFSCTNCRFSPGLYIRGPSPVRTADFPPVCTPEALLLYGLPVFSLFVHQKPFSCTNCRFSPCLYTRSPSPVRIAGFLLVCTPEALLLYELTANTLRIMGREYPLRIESV